MRKQSWFEVRNNAGSDAELIIYDEIGLWGITALDCITELNRIPAADSLTVRINSPGGMVSHGIAIYNALLRRTGRVTVTIDGLAASIASVVAMAGDPVNIAETALMMIHDPAAIAHGTADDMDKTADALRLHKEAIISAYERKTNLRRDDIADMMTDETWLSARDAVEKGFADEISSAIDIAASVRGFDLSGFSNLPQQIRTLSNVSSQSIKGKDEWFTSPTLRAEFGGDRESYLAYQNAVARGLVGANKGAGVPS